MLRDVLKSVVKGPWKKLVNEFISEEALSNFLMAAFVRYLENSATRQFYEFYDDMM